MGVGGIHVGREVEQEGGGEELVVTVFHVVLLLSNIHGVNRRLTFKDQPKHLGSTA